MDRFENYQLGSWTNNGLLIDTAERVDEVFSILKERVKGLASSALFVCAAMTMSASPVALAAASVEGFGVTAVSSAPTSSSTINRSIISASLALVDEQLSTLSSLVGRIKEGTLMASDASTPSLRKRAVAAVMANRLQPVENWAKQLVASIPFEG